MSPGEGGGCRTARGGERPVWRRRPGSPDVAFDLLVGLIFSAEQVIIFFSF